MNAPAYNPAAGGPAAIDAQSSSGEREALIEAAYMAERAKHSPFSWPARDWFYLGVRTADMLAADAQLYGRRLGGDAPELTAEQIAFTNAQQVAVPHGWANMPARMQISIDELQAEVAIYQQGCDLRDAKIAELNSLLAAAPQPPQADTPEQLLQSIATFGELQNQAPQARELSDAASDVLSERQRQVSVEGWTPEHDDEHNHCELGRAAACYAVGSTWGGHWPDGWDFKDAGGPQMGPGHRRNLVKAAALLVAEIERLDRAVLAARSEP